MCCIYGPGINAPGGGGAMPGIICQRHNQNNSALLINIVDTQNIPGHNGHKEDRHKHNLPFAQPPRPVAVVAVVAVAVPAAAAAVVVAEPVGAEPAVVVGRQQQPALDSPPRKAEAAGAAVAEDHRRSQAGSSAPSPFPCVATVAGEVAGAVAVVVEVARRWVGRVACSACPGTARGRRRRLRRQPWRI